MTDADPLSVPEQYDILHGIFDDHDAVMLLIDPRNGRIADANHAAELFYGYTREQFRAMHLTDINPLPPARILRELGESLRKEKNLYTVQNQLANGEIRLVEVRASPIQLQKHTYILSIVHDVSAHRRAEQQYRALFDRMMDGVYRSTHAGQFVEINAAMVKMFGYTSREEMLAVDIKNELYFDPTERGSHVLDTGQEETDVYRMRRKDGSEIWVEDHGSYVHDENGKILYHEGVLRDVSERVRAQETSAQYTRRLKILYHASRELSSSFNKRHIYQVTRESVEQLIACNTCLISSYERRSQSVTMSYGWHDGHEIDTNQYPAIPLESKGKGIQSEVIREKKPLLVSDYQARLKNVQSVYRFDSDGKPIEQPTEEADIPRSALLAPMIVENQIIGVIQVFNYQKNAYQESDLNLLDMLASQTAAALINSDLFQQVQQENRERKQAEIALRARTRELETLFSISNHISFVQNEDEALPHLLTEMERDIEADSTAVLLFDDARTRLSVSHASGDFLPNAGMSFEISNEVQGALFKSRQIHHIETQANEIIALPGFEGLNAAGNALLTPILSGEQHIGALLIARKKDKQLPFSAGTKRLVITISELLGNAINRMRLHAETLKRLDQLQTLRVIDQAIASNFDLRITLNILLKHTLAQLGANAADILILEPGEQILRYSAGQGFHYSGVETSSVPLNGAYAGRCARERRVIHVRPQEARENPIFFRLWEEEKFSQYICAPLVAKGEVKGVLEVYLQQNNAFAEEWLNFLEILAGQAAISIDNAQMFENLQSANMELAIAYDATIEGWSRALDLRDKETEGHTQRVTELTLLLTREMGINSKELLHIRRGALLHDIGKMGIPDNILLKKAALTPKEWEIMRSHPVLAFEMLQPIRYLQPALDIPYAHHEHWDGSGYPRGLKGEGIPLAARIFAVIDVYDALTSSRPYRRAWSKKRALAYIRERSGTEFDSKVVDAFVKMIDDMLTL